MKNYKLEKLQNNETFITHEKGNFRMDINPDIQYEPLSDRLQREINKVKNGAPDNEYEIAGRQFEAMREAAIQKWSRHGLLEGLTGNTDTIEYNVSISPSSRENYRIRGGESIDMPVRRVFKIPVGNIPTEDIQAYIDDVVQKMCSGRIFEPMDEVEFPKVKRKFS